MEEIHAMLLQANAKIYFEIYNNSWQEKSMLFLRQRYNIDTSLQITIILLFVLQ